MLKKAISAVFLLVTLSGFAQQGTLFGLVTDSSSLPLPGVSVSVPGTALVTTTDSTGHYLLSLPSHKGIQVVYHHTGCDPVSVNVFLLENEKQEYNIALTCLTVIGPVRVHDDIRNLPVIKIDIDKFEMISTTLDPVTAAIKILGGSNNNELSSQYNVRGGNFDENLVYVNGFEIYRPFLVHSGEQEGLPFINSDLVGSLSFSTGGFEAKYGDKMSSVLDVNYKQPNHFKATATASLLGANAHFEGSTAHRRFTYLVGLRQKSNQYLLGSLETKGDYKPSFSDIQGYFTYYITDVTELSFLGYYSRNVYRFIPQSRVTTFGLVNQAIRLQVNFEGQELDAYNVFTGGLKLKMEPRLRGGNKRLVLNFMASAFNTNESETSDVIGQYFIYAVASDLGQNNFGQNAYSLGSGETQNWARNYLDATVASLEHQGQYTKRGSHNIMNWGVKYSREIIHDQINQWQRLDSAFYSLPFSDSVLNLEQVIKTSADLVSNRFSGFFEDTYLFPGKREFTLHGGIRLGYWDVNHQWIVSPRFQFSWKPLWKKDWVLRGAAGVYQQPPFFRELRDLQGVIHRDVKAQTSYQFVFGGDHNFELWGRSFKFVTEGYYKLLENLNPYELDNVRIDYFAQNNAHGYATGVDFRLNGEFVKDAESWISLSLLKTMEDISGDIGTNAGTWDPHGLHNEVPINGLFYQAARTDTFSPGYIPRPTDQRINFGLFWQDYIPNHPQFRVNINVLVGTGLPFGPPDHERYRDVLRIPPYRRLDIGFSAILLDGKKNHNPFWKHFNSIWTSLEIFNLLQVNNTISYLWIKDFDNTVYAIPNYLTSRRIDLKFMIKF